MDPTHFWGKWSATDPNYAWGKWLGMGPNHFLVPLNTFRREPSRKSDESHGLKVMRDTKEWLGPIPSHFPRKWLGFIPNHFPKKWLGSIPNHFPKKLLGFA